MAANAIAFVVIFLLVASNDRLAADDFHYLVKTKELGIWDAMRFYYQNWNPRWSATLMTNTVLNSYSSTTSLLLFHFASLMFAFAAVFAFVKAVIAQMKLSLKNWQSTVLAMYLLAVIFYGSFSRDDTWFWLTVNPMYFWGSFSAVLGGSTILMKGWKLIRIPLTALLFLYAGGASETVAISAIVVLFFLGFVTHKKQFPIQIDRTALHVATIGCLIGFGIDVAGHGAQVRFAHLPQLTLSEKALVGFWNYIKFTLKEIPLTLPAFIVGAAPFAFLGRKQLHFQLISWKELLLVDRKLWIIADLLVFVMAFTMAFSMGEMGPERAWFPLTFVVLIFSVVFAYQLGTWLYIQTKGKLYQLVMLSLMLALFFQVGMGFYQVRTTSIYAKAVDQRMEFISALSPTDSVIELQPLPFSGWLFSAEITADTSHFTNKHLGLYFQNKHAFVLRDTVTSSQ